MLSSRALPRLQEGELHQLKNNKEEVVRLTDTFYREEENIYQGDQLIATDFNNIDGFWDTLAAYSGLKPTF